jgi:hypothetical protein
VTIGIIEFEAAESDFRLRDWRIAAQPILCEFFVHRINIRHDHQQRRFFDIARSVLAEVSNQRPTTDTGVSRKVFLEPVNPVFIEAKYVTVKVDAGLGIFNS